MNEQVRMYPELRGNQNDESISYKLYNTDPEPCCEPCTRITTADIERAGR